MHVRLCVFLALALFVHDVSPLNILGIFEVPSRSVHILGYDLLHGLAKRGYNVTLVSAFPLEKPPAPNFTHVYLDNVLEYKEERMGNHIHGLSKLGILTVLNAQSNFVNIGMSSKNFQDFLKSHSKYDVVIQIYAMNEAYLGLADHFDARVIGFVPLNGLPFTDSLTGNSAPPSYVPLIFYDDMSFMQRTLNTLTSVLATLVHKFYLFPLQANLLQKYFPQAPPLQQIQSDRVDLIFANVHFSSETPRPKTPNVVHIGGYHVQEPEPLPEELQKYLDNTPEGLIFLGFGTNIKTSELPKEKLEAFTNAFAKSPYKILFKYEGDLPNKPKNVHTSSWYPQKGVLAHPNTKVFISHGGRGSSTEALYYGVPTLCVSFFGDQQKNCQDIAEFGYGIHLPFQQVTRESFENALNEITENPKYRENAKYRADLFREQEMNPLDRAIFWIEHVHKFKGAKHLKPKSATMPLYQYLLLDVWLFIITTFAVISFVVYKISKVILKAICRKYLCCKKQGGGTEKLKKN